MQRRRGLSRKVSLWAPAIPLSLELLCHTNSPIDEPIKRISSSDYLPGAQVQLLFIQTIESRDARSGLQFNQSNTIQINKIQSNSLGKKRKKKSTAQAVIGNISVKCRTFAHAHTHSSIMTKVCLGQLLRKLHACSSGPMYLWSRLVLVGLFFVINTTAIPVTVSRQMKEQHIWRIS